VFVADRVATPRGPLGGCLIGEGVDDEEVWLEEDIAVPFLVAGTGVGACLRLIVCFAASRNWAAVLAKDADDASAISRLYFID
jgi:hypothetical protein